MAEVPEKSELDKLRERLMVAPALVWDKVEDAEREALMAYGERYKAFLDAAKTAGYPVTLYEGQDAEAQARQRAASARSSSYADTMLTPYWR